MFSLGDESTWEALCKEDAPDGLVVVAAMDEHAIPSCCKDSDCITDVEEYALLLKIRVTQMVVDDGETRIKVAS